MLRLLSDHNFNGRILRGLRRRIDDLDLVRALEVGLATAEDAELLAWAASENRIILSHDVNTLTKFAYERIAEAKPMSGVFIVPEAMSIGRAIDDLELAIRSLSPEECKDQVIYFPL